MIRHQPPARVSKRAAFQPSLGAAGYTLLELIITLTILAILVTAAIPMARNAGKRAKEMELRENLHEIRLGIDRYYVACVSGLVGPLDRKPDDMFYPPTLEVLVDGVIPPNTTRK